MKVRAIPVLLTAVLLGASILTPTANSGPTLGRNGARLSVVKYVYRTRWCGSTYFKLSLASSQHPLINGTVGAVSVTPETVTIKPGLGANPNRIKYDVMDAKHPVKLHLLTCVRSRPGRPTLIIVSYSSGGSATSYTLYPLKVKNLFWRMRVRQPWLIKKSVHQGVT